jgi:ADP-ribosylglycohydrolase
MSELAVLKLKPEALQKWQLPEQEYYLPTEALFASVSENSNMRPELLLHGMQLKLSEPNADFRLIHTAMFALFNTLYEVSLETETKTEGNNWSLKYGDIDLANDEIVTIQRQNRLLAAFRQEGPDLIMCAYEPLDDQALSKIKSICQDVDKMVNETVAEKKLQYAAHLSSGFGQMYAADAGRSYLSYWQHGLGVCNDGTLAEIWHKQAGLKSIPHMHIGTQLQVHEFFDHLEFNYAAYMRPLRDSGSWPAIQDEKLNSEQRSKFIGCLLGGAIGDAFGAPVEFMSRASILAKHGKNGVTSLLPAYDKIGAITDDTQMTLFTAEGLLRAYVRGCHKGITSWVGCIGHAYQRWLQTQSYDSPQNLYVVNDGLLWNVKALHSRRAPGNTCLNALSCANNFEEYAVNDSKGCGGVMRVAPIGLMCWRLKESFTVVDCFDLASDAAQLTHGHPTGYLAAGAFAAIVYQLLEGQTLVEATQHILQMLKDKRDSAETIEALKQAVALSKTRLDTSLAITKMGEGWIAEEALAISVYSVLVARDFNQLMTISVSHDGDSDSTGAIAGNLWGVIHGLVSIDKELIEQVELADLIAEVASDLFDFPTWDIGLYSTDKEFNSLVSQKYPGV